MTVSCSTMAMMLIVVFLALFKTIFGLETSDASFTYSLYLDEGEKYQLFWRYNETDITFKTKVQTKGYIGFGLSGNGGMKGSDIVIGWVKDGQSYFKDRHAKGNMKPEIDPEQNWKLLHAEEDQTTTTLIFTRPLRSCDTEHDLNIQRETQRLIWSFSNDDPLSEDGIVYHGYTNRGSRSVYLMLDQPPPASMPENVQYFDILNRNVQLPSADTTYWRIAFKLPELDEKHHIIGMEPQVNEQNKGILHHILLYVCTSTEIEDSMHGRGWLFYNQPPIMNSCEAIMFGWGIGGGSYYLPDNIGVPIGGEVKTKFVLMETHYDNPQMRSDIVDNSGLRLFYTQDLRTHDAGLLLLGVPILGSLAIPPHADSFRTVGYCPGDCTSMAFANRPQGVKMFSGVLHSHLVGRRIRLRHVRNGTELPPLMSDETFDFNYQETRALPEPVTVLPGDDLILECDYGTKDRDGITVGGLGGREEMCLAFMMYYPFVDFRQCLGGVTMAQTLSFMDGIKVRDNRVVSPGQYENNTLVEVLNTIDWTQKENREKLEKAAAKGRINYYCSTASGDAYPEIDSPAITKPYIKELDFCRLGERLQESPQDDTIAPEELPYWAELEKDKFYVAWDYNDAFITFHVTAKTLGWVGFGLSPYGKMENSDVVIGWVEDDRAQFSDRFAEGHRMPKIDELQNWVILRGWEQNGYTTLEFRRNLITCDPLDRNITEGNIHVIWAYDDQDPQDASSIRKHSNRGSKVLRLMNGPLKPSVGKEDGSVQIEFKNPDVPITTTTSTYYNVGLKMPELNEKHQLIKVEPLIQPGNEDFIYHLAVYGCTGEVPDEFHGRGFDIKEDVIHEILQCSVYLGAWIKGTKMYEYPSDFGFPIGGPNNPIKFVRFETLFSNPNRISGLQDSSGLRLTLIPANRKYDVGFLRVGHSADFGSTHLISPGVGEFMMRGYCMADCLDQDLKDHSEGITVIGVTLHSHRLATTITLRHIRNNREITPILKEPNFNFTSQDMVMLKDPIQIKSGDELIVDCTINTTSSSNLLLGGPMADNQPCVAVLMYYPPTDLGICESASPPTEMLDIVDGFTYSGSAWQPTIQSPDAWKGKNFYEVIETLDLSDEKLKRALQTKMTQGKTSSFCFARSQAPTMNPNQETLSPPTFTKRTDPVPQCPENMSTPTAPTRIPTTRPPIRYYTTPRAGGSNITPAKTAILCFVLMVFLLH